MKDLNNLETSTFINDEINILDLLKILSNDRLTISVITGAISLLAIIYSLFLPNIYESKILLAPNEGSSNQQQISRNYGALANMAGINLSSGVVRSNSSKAIEKLSSLSFFENNIMPNIYLPDLIAVKSWSALENSITYDEKIFNQSKNEWIRSYKYFGKAPSAQTSFSAFKLNHFSVSEDRETGFVTIKIKHQSPYIAKTWGEILVNEINSFYREKDRDDAQKAVDYLSEQILNINLADIKQVVAVLLQQEIQKLTLIEVNESYVYEYIDPPALMESKVGPNRLLIIIQAIIFGFILGSLLVLVKHYFKKELD